MKKLPELYKNLNINPENHNQEKCLLRKVDNKYKKEVLDKIFNGLGYSYNKKVIIETNNNSIETYLVSRTSDSVVTLDNKVIKIDDIVDIEIK